MSQITGKIGVVNRYFWIVAAIAAASLFAGCTKGNKAVPKAKPRVESPAPHKDSPKLKATIDQVTLTWQDGSKIRFTATAGKAKGNEITGTGTLLDATAELYRDGKKATLLKAPKMSANRKTGVVTATGGTVLESVERKTVLQCPDIEWRANEHKITGFGGVTVDSENGRISADSFTADTELKTIEFHAGQSGGHAILRGG